MISPPIRLFIIGVILAELYQWADWMKKNSGQPRLGYWKTDLPQLLTNAVVDAGICILWAFNGLDAFIKWGVEAAAALGIATPNWATSGIPYTQEMGLGLGIFVDIMADRIASTVMLFVRKKEG